MSGPRSTQRMPLRDTSRRVWRAVAARGPTGVGSLQLIEHFAGQIDSEPLSETLQSLRRGGYLHGTRNGRWTTWMATERVPLGEDLPAWLDEVETESDAQLDVAATAAAVVASAKARGVPVWPFGRLPASSALDDEEAPAAAEAATPPPPPRREIYFVAPEPRFALDSAGGLSLRADGIDGRLSAESTRALFAWLDRLAGSHLSDVIEDRS